MARRNNLINTLAVLDKIDQKIKIARDQRSELTERLLMGLKEVIVNEQRVVVETSEVIDSHNNEYEGGR